MKKLPITNYQLPKKNLQPTTYIPSVALAKEGNRQLNIGWLYPEYMSTYGDRGNIIVLEKRCLWRKIGVEIIPIKLGNDTKLLSKCDMLIGGGAQDRQQEQVAKDLRVNKKDILTDMFKRGAPGLFVCGSPQLLGLYYTTGDGKKLEGLGIFDFVTKHFGNDKPRCIGNTAGEIVVSSQLSVVSNRKTIVGFENHGGRTYLEKGQKPFAQVIKGYGNNGEDGTEGAIYNNVLACYYHGPLLPKNPHIADWLIYKALEVKYGKVIEFIPLEDTLEWKAHEFMLRKMGIK